MLRSMKALYELGFSRRAVCEWQLGLFSDESDGAILLRFFSEGWTCWKAENYPMCWEIGSVILSCFWCRRTQLDPLLRITCFYCFSVNLVVYAAAHAITWSLQTDSPHGARPRRCLQPAQARRVGAAEREGCYVACYIAVLHHTFQLSNIMLYSNVTSHLPAVT